MSVKPELQLTLEQCTERCVDNAYQQRKGNCLEYDENASSTMEQNPSGWKSTNPHQYHNHGEYTKEGSYN